MIKLVTWVDNLSFFGSNPNGLAQHMAQDGTGRKLRTSFNKVTESKSTEAVGGWKTGGFNCRTRAWLTRPPPLHCNVAGPRFRLT